MKTKEIQQKITRQISRKLEKLRELKNTAAGISSWSKYIRSGLGMSASQLADRLNLAQHTVSEAEKREEQGRLTVKKLRQIADALECDLVYTFVPKLSLEETIEKQARKKSSRNIDLAETHMSLEDQSVLLSKDERMRYLIEENKYSKYLWDVDSKDKKANKK